MSESFEMHQLLALGGLFDQQWDTFIPRPGQQRMAALIEQAMTDTKPLVVEAPSGSGKTIAYLLPIIAGKKRAIISTASRYLQNQLYQHDIPLIQKILTSSRLVAMLQGRSHYLCPYYLIENQSSESTLSFVKKQQLQNISRRFRKTAIGELDRLIPELDASLRPYITSSSDDCLGKQCPQYSQCPLMKAREKAQRADIVIVNHSLMFTDQMLRREQLRDLLPDTEVVVVDEAHRITDFAQTIIGLSLSSYKLRAFLRDSRKVINQHAPEQRSLIRFIDQLEQALNRVAELASTFDSYQRFQHAAIVDQFADGLDKLHKGLLPLVDREHGFSELAVRNGLLVEKLKSISLSPGLCWVHCRSSRGTEFTMQSIPTDLAPLIKALLADVKGSWIFTSATLSVTANPARFLKSLGLPESSFHRVSSAFDLQRQARLYTPFIKLNPHHQQYSDAFVEQLLPLLDVANGRVLCLFSSYRSLGLAAELLQQRTDFPVLVQRSKQERGKLANEQLIEQFKAVKKGVLLGTGSFWEGLDLSGVPLRAVVMDKLPFASPEDPLVKLRAGELTRHGVDSFEHDLLPDAVIRFQQGCGRLLRRLSDRGIIMVTDRRLHTKAYGQLFIDSINIPQLTSIDTVADFFAAESLNSEKT